MKRSHLAALALVLLAVRFTVAFVVVPRWQQEVGVGSFPDAYPELAKSLLAGRGLAFEDSLQPTTVRGPGYPMWLAAGMLAGFRSMPLLAFWSTLPGMASALALAWFVGHRYGGRTGLMAGALAGLSPLAIFIAGRCMSDEFYAALAMGAAVLLWSESGGGGIWPSWRGLGAGALLSLHILTRSMGIISLAALLASRPRTRKGALQSAVIAVLALVPVLGWSVRTSLLEGRPVFVQSLAGYNFWIGEAYYRHEAASTWMETHERELELLLKMASVAHTERFWYGHLTPAETADMERKLVAAAVERVRRHPVDYLKRVLLGIPRFWFQAQTSSRTAQYLIVILPFLLVGVFGAIRATDLDSGVRRSALMVIGLHNLAYAMLLPVARMSVQVTPFVSMFIAYGAADLVPRVRSVCQRARSNT